MLEEKKKSLPLVSIVTVTFNAIDTIEKTILSVINQDYPNIEYIIVDGGSNDGTLDIIKKYENRLSKWISEKDEGLYDAMNKGLRMATGTWISFKNSGDYFAEKKSLSKLFSDLIPEDVAFIYADCYRITEWGWKIEKPKDLSLYKEVMPVIHPATFVRTSYHKKHPFDTRYRVCADYGLVFNAINEGEKFLYRPFPIVIFPTGGFSTLHWEDSYWGGLSIAGKLSTTSQRLFFHFKFYSLKFEHFIKDKLKKIPFVKRHWDRSQSKRYKSLPLPIEKFY